MGVVIKIWEEEGTKIPAPYERIVKYLIGPDKDNRTDLKFNLAYCLISPHSKSDNHTHTDNEVIYVISGRGKATFGDGDKKIEIGPDVVLMSEVNERHQIINTGDEPIKLATFHFPARTRKESLDKNIESALKAQKNMNK